MRARGSIYCTRDAPRAWWTYLRGILVSLGWESHPLEDAVFCLRDPNTHRLVGLMMTHVDDLLFAGEG
eukprot:2822415-Amphidinium_carterae.1